MSKVRSSLVSTNLIQNVFIIFIPLQIRQNLIERAKFVIKLYYIMPENQIKYCGVLLAHNVNYIFPEIFSHFLLLDQVNNRNYNVIE